ncbi:MAG TPA: endoglucanase [Myxococcales bacterium]|nr:endoglucanase [Deltaproteobacteria bacterium]HAA56466.1 endoglucanase [Myxococcales bacterium]
MKLLQQLCELQGVPGREEEVRDFILEQVKDHVDSYEIDPMGNLICKRLCEGSDRWVMVACHMDEIGFYVRYIDKKGYVRVQAAGGFDTRNLFARRVTINTRSGKIVGTMNPGGPPIHIATPEDRKKVPEVKEFYIDLGLPAEEVKKKVRVGDPVALNQDFVEIGQYVSCKSMDNRTACWTGINLLKELTQPTQNIAVVFTVQEEVGLRGAVTSAFTVDADVSIAIDVTLACDTPGIDEEDYISELGKGTAIKVFDSSMISDHGLREQMIELAEKNNIPHQLELLPRGGTDAGALQRSRGGSKAITLSIPTRYIHTITETIHPDDLRATLSLLKAYCEAPVQ